MCSVMVKATSILTLNGTVLLICCGSSIRVVTGIVKVSIQKYL